MNFYQLKKIALDGSLSKFLKLVEWLENRVVSRSDKNFSVDKPT